MLDTKKKKKALKYLYTFTAMKLYHDLYDMQIEIPLYPAISNRCTL